MNLSMGKMNIIFLVFNICLLVYLVVQLLFLNDELASKPEWSALQNLKQPQSVENDKLIIIKKNVGWNGNYDALAIKNREMPEWVWLLTNTTATPHIKVVQKFSKIRLSKSDWEIIKKAKIRMTPDVRSFLKNAVE